MAIREFELFHGAFLTKLVRSDRPLSLCMIETRPGEAWSSYRINDAAHVVIKHSSAPRRLKRHRGGLAWTFVFNHDQLAQTNTTGAWVALLCGSSRLTDHMEVCLLQPDEVTSLLNFSGNGQQAITVKYLPGKSLRVRSAQVDELIVPRNRADEWTPPGS